MSTAVPPAAAETAAPVDEPAPAAQASTCCSVPALTSVEIEVAEPLSSKESQTRQMFAIRLAAPLIVDGRVVAPAGTQGAGEVVHAAKARAAGKAGELILAARYLEVGGRRLPLRSFSYGSAQGADNSGAVMAGGMAAAAVLPVAAVLGYLVVGGEVRVPAGTRATAKVAAETVLPPLE